MSTPPSRCSASGNEPSGSSVTFLRCAKWTRGANSRTIATDTAIFGRTAVTKARKSAGESPTAQSGKVRTDSHATWKSCTHHSLGHKHIDVRRWLGHHPVDERGFAAVTAKIARIKNPHSGRLDQQHEGVEG